MRVAGWRFGWLPGQERLKCSTLYTNHLCKHRRLVCSERVSIRNLQQRSEDELLVVDISDLELGKMRLGLDLGP